MALTAQALRRGNLVTVALQGQLGKPRPALVVQADALRALGSVLICPITSELHDAALFRVTVEPDAGNGLARLSQVMVDKLTAAPRDKLSAPIGQLGSERMQAVERAMTLVLGLA